MIKLDYILTILTLVFIGVGGIFFLVTIIFYSCEEGSCGCWEICRCCILLNTCCSCDINKYDCLRGDKEKNV